MKKNKKFVSFFSRMLVLTLVLVLGIGLLGCGKKGYRLIQVYEVNGTATLERENIGTMDAYENLNLLSGDLLSVLQESFLRLKLDEDKYMLVEQNSVLSIYATGDEKNSATDINLEQGAVTIEVQNKLSDESSFEVTTPNSVMAVRGTVFRVSVETDENGKSKVTFSVLEGTIKIQEKDEDGNLGEVIEIPSGKEAIVYEKDEQVEVILLDEIDTSALSVASLEFLNDVIEGGRELCFTQEVIQKAIQEIKEAESNGTEESDNVEDTTQDGEEAVGSDEALDDGNEEEAETPSQKPSQNNNNTNQRPSNNTGSNQSSDEPNDDEPSDNPGGNDQSADEPSDTPKQDEPSDNPGGNDQSADEPSDTPKQDEPSDAPGGNDQSADEPSDTPKQDEPSDNPGGNQPSDEPEIYTVTFQYNGKVFGTQSVEEGQKAVEPTLMPAQSGSWNFDFDTPITKDTVIEFVEE